ncbi:ABSCISIC ACID-INSENSITIVE 5-like protein 1 isoform X2 [Tripterygium wilfordii]|uniref:ABSCISIC ACID-INSENSITIVE 5-like protein 1 isoform X2 n=1 Tax=Tripterygium wilfordii TaxID=458696 RepID=A0A7J7DER4_TRIWF|nr:ABSCISIC ACID-INSENSITIVE 5-like protein 1 isoform X2 [Tripterygium wilfordii]
MRINFPRSLCYKTKPTNYTNGIANQATLQRQASLSVPATLCKKTVDEVWFEIQKEHNPNNVCRVRGPPQRTQTLGEMTLEEFLVQAGIVQGAPMSSQQRMVTAIQSNNNGNTTACLDANFQMGHVLGIGFSAHPSLNGFATYQTFSQTKC